MKDVTVVLPADELERTLELSLSDATLLDLMMVIRSGDDPFEGGIEERSDGDSLLAALAELIDKVGLLSRKVENLEDSVHELDRHLIAIYKSDNEEV